MKIIVYILFFLSFLSYICCLSLQEAKQHVQECLEEFKMSKQELATLRNGNSQQLHCFTACIMKKRGTLKNGKIDQNNMLSVLKDLRVLNSTITEERVTRCVAAANTERDECSVARDMIGCLFFKTPQ